MAAGIVDEVAPAEAYAILETDPDSAMVDVRTRAEWTFVGLADLSGLGRRLGTVEWITFPEMAPNPAFMAELERAFGGRLPKRLFFICRSGSRSRSAAERVAGLAGIHCTNVAEGFEGDLDARGHRGASGGWKAAGLPWRQG